MSETRGWSWKAVVFEAAAVVVVSIVVMSVAGNVATAKPRFVDNGDGTITDTQTGLMWETKKNGGGGPRDVNNLYSWSGPSGSDPDGTLFTDFLRQMNCETSATKDCPFDGKYRDWRIPTVAELRSILTAEFPNCPASPCIDSIFGPTSAGPYWSSTSYAPYLGLRWVVNFNDGNAGQFGHADMWARAVRGGS